MVGSGTARYGFRNCDGGMLVSADQKAIEAARRALEMIREKDAGRALLAALDAPSGIYNVVRDGERVSNERFKRATGWLPKH